MDDSRVLNGIFWVLRSGAPWRDLPGLASRRNLLRLTNQHRCSLCQFLTDCPWHLPVRLSTRIRHLDNWLALWIELVVLLPIVEREAVYVVDERLRRRVLDED